MEQRKPRNKRGAKQNQRSKVTQASPVVDSTPTNSQDQTSGIKKLTEEDYDYKNSDKSQFAHLKRETEEIAQLHVEKAHAKRQIVSNWSKYEERQNEEVSGKDFQSLLDAPISEGGHFIFKSEKNWAVEISKYSELFSLNVKKLAAAIDCIPFTHYVEVEDKYFTKDQLTRIHNKAEKAKSIFSATSDDVHNDNILTCLKDCVREVIEDDIKTELDSDPEEEIDILVTTEEKKEATDDSEEDLEFLLSLKEPVESGLSVVTNAALLHRTEEAKTQPEAAPTKSIDLEKWLDSVLDD